MGMRNGEQVTVLTATTTADRHGNVVRVWTDPESSTVCKAGVAPVSSSEDNDGRTEVASQLDVYLPADVIVDPFDRMVIRSETWEVVGDPAVWRSPLSGWRPGSVVRVRKVDG